MASTRAPMPTLREMRRRTRRGKEARDTLAAVNFVYVIAGTDFFEGFSVYSGPFLSLIPPCLSQTWFGSGPCVDALCRTAPCA